MIGAERTEEAVFVLRRRMLGIPLLSTPCLGNPSSVLAVGVILASLPVTVVSGLPFRATKGIPSASEIDNTSLERR